MCVFVCVSVSVVCLCVCVCVCVKMSGNQSRSEVLKSEFSERFTPRTDSVVLTLAIYVILETPGFYKLSTFLLECVLANGHQNFFLCEHLIFKLMNYKNGACVSASWVKLAKTAYFGQSR